MNYSAYSFLGKNNYLMDQQIPYYNEDKIGGAA
jgi:hypothetical protein